MKRYGNYIGGEWIESGPAFENRNPADTGEVVGEFVAGSAEDIAAAAEAAARALDGWAGTNAPARGNILFKAAEILDRRFEQIAAEMTREEGKTLPEARRSEERRVG